MTRREIFSAFGLAVAGALAPKLNAKPWTNPRHAVVTARSALGAQTMLTDKWKNMIPLAFEWNMDTEMAGVFISVTSTKRSDKTGAKNRVAVTGKTMAKGEAAKAYVHLPGCKLRWRDTGKVVTREEILKGMQS